MMMKIMKNDHGKVVRFLECVVSLGNIQKKTFGKIMVEKYWWKLITESNDGKWWKNLVTVKPMKNRKHIFRKEPPEILCRSHIESSQEDRKSFKVWHFKFLTYFSKIMIYHDILTIEENFILFKIL